MSSRTELDATTQPPRCVSLSTTTGCGQCGLLLPATAHHLGLRELVDHHLDLGVAPGRANTGDKMLTLVASALAGGDCIDDADALRAGGTARILATIKAPSTLGTFLRSFRWGHAGGPGDLLVAGTRLAGRRRTRRLAPHRPGLNHLRGKEGASSGALPVAAGTGARADEGSCSW